MNLAVAARDYRGICYNIPSRAVSDEANKVGQALSQILEALATLASVQPRLTAMRELDRIYAECSKENWDEEGADAISEPTYQEAMKFLALLPLTLPTPEAVPE